MQRNRIVIGLVANILFIFVLISAIVQAAPPEVTAVRGPVDGPFSGEPTLPTVFNGDLRDLPQIEDTDPRVPIPLRYIPGQEPKDPIEGLLNWTDPVAQTAEGNGQMPPPIANFAGLDFAGFGAGYPPDTNGDVGPEYYIQTVNTSVGIYEKDTGTRVVGLSFDAFFQGPAGTPCDTSNAGDPVALYDPMADRWIVTDFAWFNFNTGPYYECIAVSQTGDPVSGGWYFYALQADTGFFAGYLNDYPKLGVWPDGWYMTANMFQINPPGDGFGVRVWALDRDSMLSGGPLNEVHFDVCTDGTCGALLPSNLRGELPPPGAPNYFVTTSAPDLLQIWEFHVDWVTPGNSTFSGPVDLQVAPFVIAASVPQPNTGTLLDSLSFRPMMQLQYRNIDGDESLWLNHSVAATDGIGGVRWYEVVDPGGAPTVAQQATYQPDGHYRWMGSLAVDQDGNMAVGYSASSTSLFPSIRYAGRYAGEAPDLLPQAEESLIEGTGSQTGISRWGDYSTMTVDPTDDCTFWYTTEYYITTGSNWQTRIGSFKLPSCGEPKAFLDGHVYDSVSDDPLPGVLVTANSPTQTLTVETDATGYYTITLLAGTYDLTAGPLEPGYPDPVTIPDVETTTGNTTSTDIYLDPAPFLVEGDNLVEDSGPLANGNGVPEPGEQGILLWESLTNIGATMATNIEATLSSSTAGVTVDVADAPYPDIDTGETITNTTAFVFSLDASISCGEELSFHKAVSSTEGDYEIDFNLIAAIVEPRMDIFFNDVESGAAGWTTGGTGNNWAITDEEAHSPTHSWTDSPGGNYPNNVNSYLRTQAYDLSGKKNVKIDGWYKYRLEAGYDYVYLEYSLDGGSSWVTGDPLHVFNAYEEEWINIVVDAPALEDQPDVALRWRFTSDGGVVDDGIYIDDVSLSGQSISCEYEPPMAPEAPTLVAPADGSTVETNDVTFVWDPPASGPDPDGYEIEVDGMTYTVTAPITSTTVTFSEGNHDWRARSFNDVGFSDYTESWSFDIELPVTMYFQFLPVVLKP